MASGVVVIFLILVAIFGPFLVQNPTIYHANLINPTFSAPERAVRRDQRGAPARRRAGDRPRPAQPGRQRGAGARCSSRSWPPLLAVGIGIVMGVIAGYFGGWVDAVIARTMDVFLAFPLLVFAIALVGVIPSSAFGLSGNSLRIGLLIFVIGFFAWPYMGRIIRGPDAVAAGAGVRRRRPQPRRRGPYILFRELLPNLVGADPGLLDAADPDQHPVRGGPVLPRAWASSRPRRAGAADALGRGAQRLLLDRPDVHDHPRPGHLHHRAWPSTCSATGCATRSTREQPGRPVQMCSRHQMQQTRQEAFHLMKRDAGLSGWRRVGGGCAPSRWRRAAAAAAAAAAATAAARASTPATSTYSVVNPSTAQGRDAHRSTTAAPRTPPTRATPTTRTTWNFTRLYATAADDLQGLPGQRAACRLVPALATAPGAVADNGLTWTYHIKPGVKFEDGTAVTSQDVKYAVERTFDRGVLPNGPSYFTCRCWPGTRRPTRARTRTGPRT